MDPILVGINGFDNNDLIWEDGDAPEFESVDGESEETAAHLVSPVKI